ncbi:MAG: DUF512 domain-containing protein, partial [Candidatus Zixiibacteriota bacterium]
GLTKYRTDLPDVALYGPAAANELITSVERLQAGLLSELGTRFVWPADELFTIAGRSFPPLSSYETLSQFENGIGMCRAFITSFNRKKRSLKTFLELNKSSRTELIALTGHSAHPWLSSELQPQARSLGVALEFHPVRNRFWGASVTVSGLLTGKDLLRAARELSGKDQVVLIPPNCLNNEDLFLDNMPLADFRSQLDARVVVGRYDLVDTITESLAPPQDSMPGAKSRRVALAEAV